MFNVKNLEDLLKSGVYRIINKTTGKFYIGSTIMSIQKRCYHHLSLLRANRHKNTYLQNAWDKYGESDFLFEILEITDKNNTLIREQYWIDYYKENNQILFNINPLASGTPNMSKETILKRAKTLKRKYASGELTPIFKKGHIPWNKGKTKENIDYSYLKKPKTLTDKVLKSREKRIINNRESSFDIFVYDLNYNFLGKWRSSKDLEEWSLTENNNLPIKSRFKGERMGKPIKFLQSVNINKSCKFNKPYKGLLFSYKPLHQVIDVEKLDKFGETPVMDNTEPTINLND
jgi:group I intron endonuclease